MRDWSIRPIMHSRGQRQLLDVVDANQLSDAEATEMLQRLNDAEPGDRVQELDRGRRQTWTQARTTSFRLQLKGARRFSGGRDVTKIKAWR